MSVGEDLFLSHLTVSRETLSRLRAYEQLLGKWNRTINLVSPSTLADIWNRHFLDSAACFTAAQQSEGRWTDLGSGGGFPGMVVAILAAEQAPGIRVTCIEADIRKSAFLQTVAGTLEVEVNVASRRIEEMPPQGAAIVSARALAPLARLLDHAERHLEPSGRAVFLKGHRWREEVEEALETHRFTIEKHPSPTHAGSAILVIGDIRRA